jgi:4-carboxymuconolactone decarboxylase
MKRALLCGDCSHLLCHGGVTIFHAVFALDDAGFIPQICRNDRPSRSASEGNTMLKSRLAAVLFAASLAGPALADPRLPTIDPSTYSDAQKQAAADFLAARKTPVFGPFQPLMYSPEVMSQARAMGDYLRYKSAIGTTLSELVILVTAREWTQDYEWYVHAPIAAKQGIKPEIIAAIRNGQRPVGMSDDETIVYDVSYEIQKNKRVSDPTYARAEARFGKQGMVDLIGITAYYTLLAMQLNAAQYVMPADGVKLPRFPE